jgi:hypothetical protein
MDALRKQEMDEYEQSLLAAESKAAQQTISMDDL